MTMQSLRVLTLPLPMLEIVLDPPPPGAGYIPPVPVSCWESEEPDDFCPETPEDIDFVIGKVGDACRVIHACADASHWKAQEAMATAAYYEWKYGADLMAFARRTLCPSAGEARPPSPPLMMGGIGLRPAGVETQGGGEECYIRVAL